MNKNTNKSIKNLVRWFNLTNNISYETYKIIIEVKGTNYRHEGRHIYYSIIQRLSNKYGDIMSKTKETIENLEEKLIETIIMKGHIHHIYNSINKRFINEHFNTIITRLIEKDLNHKHKSIILQKLSEITGYNYDKLARLVFM